MFKLTLSKQLLLCLSILLVGSAALWVALSTMTTRIEQRMSKITGQTFKAVYQLHEIRHEEQVIAAATTEIILLNILKSAKDINLVPPRDLQSVQHAFKKRDLAQTKLQHSIQTYRTYVESYGPNKVDFLERITASSAILQKQSEALVQTLRIDRAFWERKKAFDDAQAQLLRIIEKALDHEKFELRDRQNTLADTISHFQTIIWASYAGLLLVIFGIGLLLSRSIVRRLKMLSETTKKISDNNLSDRVRISGNDEVSDLAQAFNIMSDRLETMEQLRTEAENQLKLFNTHLNQRVIARTAELNIAKVQAEQASQAKSLFLSSMSHEFRTPLNAIIGFGQLLESQMEPYQIPEKDNYVHFILKNGERLLELVDEVLALSNLNDFEIELTEIDLVDVLDQAIKDITPQAKEKGIPINADEIHYFPLPSVMGNAQHLQHVIYNVLLNAILYNRREGTITIRASMAHEKIKLEITDTGHGFIEDHPGQVLEPFERLSNHASTISGAGVGLTIANIFMKKMLGKISYATKSGEGSTFWIELSEFKPPVIPSL